MWLQTNVCHNVKVLSIFCPLCVHFLSTFCPLCVRFLSTLCPFYVHFVSIFYPFLSFAGPIVVHFGAHLLSTCCLASSSVQGYRQRTSSESQTLFMDRCLEPMAEHEMQVIRCLSSRHCYIGVTHLAAQGLSRQHYIFLEKICGRKVILLGFWGQCFKISGM